MAVNVLIRGVAVAQVVEALRYKPEGRRFDCNRNDYQEYYLGVKAAGA